MTMVSELVLTRNQLIEIVRRHEDSEFKAPLQRLSNVTAELQEGVLKTRMQPIGNAWQKLPRIVRDLSAELGKPIELEMHGAETELDRQVLDLIKDPLTHMVRNSADHGLEMPARAARRRQARARARSGSPPATRAVTSSSRSPTTGAASIPSASRPRRSPSGLVVGSRNREDVGGADPEIHLRARLLDRRADHQRLRPRRRHGCRARQYRPDRRHHRREVGARPRHQLHHQDSAHARHRLGADRGSRRRSLRHSAARRGRARARAQQFGASHRAHQGRGGAAAAQQAVAARPPQDAAQARPGRAPATPTAASSWSCRSAARPSASWSTASSTPRRSW